ncbi:MAG: DUF3823 domain-containing protein [Tannerellaceae bacterium]|jgi:hypothetical protein|nr:DUF3823 domain-containing protein [Tannerellaceae bacterium]
MMKQIILLNILCLASLSLFSCGEIDNYEEPNSRIEGKLIDAVTGDLIPCQGLNGARIQMYEAESTTATSVWVGLDGTYKSERVFSGNYRIIPQGPFLPVDTVRTAVPTNGNLDFTLEPYLRIKLDEATLSGTTATLKFTISKSTQTSAALNQYGVLYSTTENIDAATGFVKRSLVTTNDAILDVQQTVTIEGIDTAKPVFVRIAARSGASTYYNYSVIKRL